MPDNGDKELVVRRRGTNGPNGGRPVVYPDETVRRALVYMQETGSPGSALHMLERELPVEQVPSYTTLWDWARAHKDVIVAIRETEKKRDMVRMADDAASDATGRMIQALPNLSDSQIPVAYGIAMQRRTDWERAGQAGTVIPIQLNVSTGGQDRANPWSKDKD